MELVGMVASLPARLAVGCGVSGFQQRIPRRLERSDIPRRFPRVRHRGRGLDRPCKGPGARRVVFPGLTAAYVAAVFAAVRVAALNAPTLPLVEVNAESDVLPDCSELPKDRTCVKSPKHRTSCTSTTSPASLLSPSSTHSPSGITRIALCYGPRVDRSEITPDIARTLRRPAS